jgi:oxygen-independent coproporphyrinogen III oxidase
MPEAPATGALLARHDRPGPRYTSYPSALEFQPSFGADDYAERLRAAARRGDPLSLYTHLPFCAERCLYCACTVVITKQARVTEPYLDRVAREVDLVGEHLGDARTVSAFHLGGGTPTYYAPERLHELFTFFRSRFRFAPDAELAVEVDPRVTSEAHLEVLAANGVNRLSFGVQDFDEQVQAAVHRVQGVALTERLMTRSRELGMDAINVDLIYGLPHQTPASFARTLDTVIALAPTRLAVYSFAFVPWVKHHQRRLPQEAMPTGLAKFELLAVARERLQGAGYVDVGMDHFARPDDELCVAQREGRLSRTFMGYTTDTAPDQIGFGLSAIGYVDGAYVQNVKKLTQYDRAIDAGALPVERGLRLSRDDLVRQAIIREWMCHFRIDVRAVEARHGVDFSRDFAPELDALAPLVDDGFVSVTDGAIDATPLGRLFPRNVAMVFDRYLRRSAPDAPRYSRTV